MMQVEDYNELRGISFEKNAKTANKLKIFLTSEVLRAIIYQKLKPVRNYYLENPE